MTVMNLQVPQKLAVELPASQEQLHSGGWSVSHSVTCYTVCHHTLRRFGSTTGHTTGSTASGRRLQSFTVRLSYARASKVFPLYFTPTSCTGTRQGAYTTVTNIESADMSVSRIRCHREVWQKTFWKIVLISSPRSQQPATRDYPEPHQSSPSPSILPF
jgi:hypothetical protein